MLNDDLNNFCDDTTLFLVMGDLNARTGNLPDNLDLDTNYDNADLRPTKFIERNNCDETFSNQGKNLMNILLIGEDLRILNDRIIGYSLGNFTTLKNGNVSVKKYGIVSGNVMNTVVNFFPSQSFYSDHP